MKIYNYWNISETQKSRSRKQQQQQQNFIPRIFLLIFQRQYQQQQIIEDFEKMKLFRLIIHVLVRNKKRVLFSTVILLVGLFIFINYYSLTYVLNCSQDDIFFHMLAYAFSFFFFFFFLSFLIEFNCYLYTSDNALTTRFNHAE